MASVAQHVCPGLRGRSARRATLSESRHHRAANHCRLLNESSELRRVWENPAVPADQKRRVLDAIAARDGISKQVRNLIGRPDRSSSHTFSGAGHSSTGERTRRQAGLRRSRYHQRRELGDAEKREFESQVEKLTGKKVRAHYGQDASLLEARWFASAAPIYDVQ